MLKPGIVSESAEIDLFSCLIYFLNIFYSGVEVV